MKKIFLYILIYFCNCNLLVSLDCQCTQQLILFVAPINEFTISSEPECFDSDTLDSDCLDSNNTDSNCRELGGNIELDYVGPAPILSIQCVDENGCGSTSFVGYYNITSNQVNKKITGMLNEILPEGQELIVYFTPPQGARTTGFQELSIFPADFITEISHTRGTSLPIEYKFISTSENTTHQLQNRVVIYTLTDG